MVATPGNGKAPGETTGQWTSSFLKAQHCQAAVNAAPFDKVTALEGRPLDVIGLQVSGGLVVSPDDGSPALLILKNGQAKIQRPPFPDQQIKEAVAGFQIVLWQGRTVATDVKLHPRTGAGVSADGRTLWLLTVDGRQAGRSEGCTTVEMADWLRAMGAQSGINLDGGGTTTMVLAKEDGKPLILNQPIHAGIPGLERPAGSHLGVHALPLVPGKN
jgi:exopolysaccharide biosynthesis protein